MITIPDTFEPLPPPPQGTRWVPRGYGWDNRGKPADFIGFDKASARWLGPYTSGCPSGMQDVFFVEAVPDGCHYRDDTPPGGPVSLTRVEGPRPPEGRVIPGFIEFTQVANGDRFRVAVPVGRIVVMFVNEADGVLKIVLTGTEGDTPVDAAESYDEILTRLAAACAR